MGNRSPFPCDIMPAVCCLTSGIFVSFERSTSLNWLKCWTIDSPKCPLSKSKWLKAAYLGSISWIFSGLLWCAFGCWTVLFLWHWNSEFWWSVKQKTVRYIITLNQYDIRSLLSFFSECFKIHWSPLVSIQLQFHVLLTFQLCNFIEIPACSVRETSRDDNHAGSRDKIWTGIRQ